ncbi:hypothetical protein ACFLSV_08710 [Bacteroidota bacterium]
MHKILKKKYYYIVVPAITIAIVLIFFKQYSILQVTPTPLVVYTISPVIFILTALFAIAFPVLHRTIFNNGIKESKFITPDKFYRYQNQLLYLIAITPYLVLIAYVLNLPHFYFGGTALFSLYALYFYYPSEKRIRNEKQIYRVKEETDNISKG